jgi:hypothetical protein
LPFPDPTNGKLCERFREVFVLVHELINPLSCNAKDFGDLTDAYRVTDHSAAHRTFDLTSSN